MSGRLDRLPELLFLYTREANQPQLRFVRIVLDVFRSRPNADKRRLIEQGCLMKTSKRGS